VTLLTTIQRAAVLIGIEPPPIVVNSTDATARQLGELARIDAEELAARFDWNSLLRDATFTTVDGSDQLGALPADFGRFPFKQDGHGELYNPGQRRGIAGPASTAQWRRTLDFNTGGWTSTWRINAGVLQIGPTAAGQSLTFRYVTNALYRPATGADKATWSADTDTCLIPEGLIALGAIWRWKQAKGFDYGEDMQTAEQQISRAAAADGGGPRTLVMGRVRLPVDTDRALEGVLGGGGNNGDYIGEF
jgi:hypothetical protein